MPSMAVISLAQVLRGILAAFSKTNVSHVTSAHQLRLSGRSTRRPNFVKTIMSLRWRNISDASYFYSPFRKKVEQVENQQSSYVHFSLFGNVVRSPGSDASSFACNSSHRPRERCLLKVHPSLLLIDPFAAFPHY